MKTLRLIPVLAVLFMVNVASMCEDDDDSPSGNPEVNLIAQNASQGTWRVTLYSDNGQNETNDFTGYNFTFGPNSVLTAVNASNTTHTGTWSVTDSSNSNDDSPESDVDFNIAFASPPNFEELTDDWDVVTYTATKIELRDVSGGNGGTDLLTFEKN